MSCCDVDAIEMRITSARWNSRGLVLIVHFTGEVSDTNSVFALLSPYDGASAVEMTVAMRNL